jgi:hypothetical protein
MSIFMHLKNIIMQNKVQDMKLSKIKINHPLDFRHVNFTWIATENSLSIVT